MAAGTCPAGGAATPSPGWPGRLGATTAWSRGRVTAVQWASLLAPRRRSARGLRNKLRQAKGTTAWAQVARDRASSVQHPLPSC